MAWPTSLSSTRRGRTVSDPFARAHGDRLSAPDSERRVLACIMLEPSILEWAEIGADMFTDPRYRAIWAAMSRLRSLSGAIDTASVTEEMRTAGRIDCLGGKTVGSVIGSTATAANVDHHIGVLSDKLITRRIFGATERATIELGQGVEGEALADMLVSELGRIDSRDRGDSATAADATRAELLSIFADADSGQLPGVKTGIKAFDHTIGGIPFGVPTIFGARPGVGKSSLALNIADNAAKAGLGVHIFTFEDRISGWSQRLLARHSGVPLDQIRSRSSLTVKDRQSLIEAADRLKNRNNLLIEHAHGMSAERLARRMRSERRKLDTQLVIVDYLQLMPGSAQKKFERVGDNVTSLAETCGKDNVAMIVLSQLNRESAREARGPQLQDFRDSGEIEQVGKLMIALDDKGVGPDSLKLVVLKNHQGNADGEVVVRFVRRHCAIF